MTTLQLLGAELSLCLPKLKHYGLLLSLVAIVALTVAFRPTEFPTDNHATKIEKVENELTVSVNNAMMPQTIVIPMTNTTDTVRIVDCEEQNSFVSDTVNSGGQYVDLTARNSGTVICPPDSSRSLRVTFMNFDLEEGDVLFAYDGVGFNNPLIGSGSGRGVANMNGGWVASNCDRTINPTGCLTFRFQTDGDNRKGAGWKAWVTCEDVSVRIAPPTNVFASLKCMELKQPVTITAGAVIANNCSLANDSVYVAVRNKKGRLCKDTCLRANQSFTIDTLAIGRYTITHTLKTNPQIAATSYAVVAPPALTCNDAVEAVFDGSCQADVRPDYILENPCDTSANLYYDIVVRTEAGRVIKTGTSRNGQYPILNKDDIELCGSTKYEVEITRVYNYNGTCCSEDIIRDVCWGYVNFVDGSKPQFTSRNVDTLMACGTINFDAVGDAITKPNVVDNCDSITLDVVNAALIQGDECSEVRTYLVTWRASDLCGNFAEQKDTLRVLRPNLKDAIKLPNVRLSCGEDTPEIMEDYDRLGIVQIPMIGDTITLSTEVYVCNYILVKNDEVVPHPGGKKIARYWAVVDGCGNIPFPVTIDTQLIEFIDTLAPTIDCSPYGTLAEAQSIALPNDMCSMAVTLPEPTATDLCTEPRVEMFMVERLEEGNWNRIASNLAEAGELECDTFRVSWQAIDVNLDSFPLRDTCVQYFRLEDRTPPNVICLDEVQVAYDQEGTRLYAAEIDNQSSDPCGIVNVEIKTEGGEWSEYLEFFCGDVHKNFQSHLRFTDKNGNTNTCSFNVTLLDNIPPYCADLPDFEGTCDNYHNGQFGESTDTNEDYTFSDSEWQDLTGDLFDEYNRAFGTPECQDNLACVPFSSQQQYQIIYEQCGVIRARRRYRIIDWNGEGIASNWKIQEININYTPGWSFTLPIDFFGECGDSVPAPSIVVDNGACDVVGWEHEDQVFDMVEDACYKVIRTYHIINWCNYVQGQDPIELNRAENVFGFVSEAATITAADVDNYGYYTYVQVLKVTDNVAPTLSINEVQTCIYGGEDADPVGVEDQTPGAAPYECDTIRIFSVEASDCEASAFRNFSFTYEVYEDSVLVESGEGAKFFWTVRPKVKYTVRFTVFDNCGNSSSLTRDYEFWDCKKPTVICIPEVNVEMSWDSTARVDANLFEKGSWDNCTPSSELRYRIWHKNISIIPPQNKEEVASLPTTIYFDCDDRGAQQIFYYVLDEENNFDFCIAMANVGNNNGFCPGNPPMARAMVAGNVETATGEKMEAVNIAVVGEGDMPTAITSANGDFDLMLETGYTYEVAPSKTEAPLNGVTTFDLILISKHILGIEPFTSPYQFIAADVNRSKTVTAFDLVQLRQLILNIHDNFQNNTSWRFVDANYQFTTSNPLEEAFNEKITINNHQTDRMDANFIAVKVGDLNGSSAANSLQKQPTSESRTARQTLTLSIADKNVDLGQIVTIDFTQQDLRNIDGYQMALDFTGLELLHIHEGIVKEAHFGQTLLNRNILLSSWDRFSGSTEPNLDDTHLFSLEFKALQAGKISDFLHLQPNTLTPEAYHLTGELLDIDLHFATTTTDFTLAQNRPNPFSEKTTIGFQLPQAGKATLTILDVQGRVILQQTRDFSAGQQQWTIEGRDLTAKGILYYQLATETAVLTKKMIVQ
ncbi:MAG: T9SS type A sorting domain-containing protein [Bacteroidota bacterium]